VTRGDLETLQDGLRQLYARHDLDSLAEAAVDLVLRLVPNDQTTYNEIDPHGKRLATITRPIGRQDAVVRLADRWEQHMHQHPLVAHYLARPADGPKKISDFLTREQFHRLDLYQEFFRHVDVEYQMVTTMPAPRPMMVGIAANRSDRDFTERDRRVLALLQPHLRQAYDNAALVGDLAAELERMHGVLDRLDRGVVLIDAEGRVESASPAAVRFFADGFADDPDATLTRRLPDALRRWAVAQVAALRREGDDLARPRQRVVEDARGRLVVRVVPDQRPDRYLLIVHRVALPTSHEPLTGLGLTDREAQVLLRMVHGEDAPSIAARLGISTRTAHKHAENLYQKLDVTSRAAAVTRALEWLRL